eukprot:CAMPEP_0118910662 /NCGR_PEP_ID=MMETSP1166-20130328/12703_1 /TAXON_ID=1104430 /ORGANISM="Chrysoreinhardia sp, Strain CCMP3193" /LENGTH=280 /DNA_ID=CAMNT_0006850129 /DNA_START=1 /DNA_END=843 /DNA_ORIENTATION=+
MVAHDHNGNPGGGAFYPAAARTAARAVDQGRRRGFESPLSCNQLVSWAGNAAVTGSFYALCCWLLVFQSLQRRRRPDIVGFFLVAHLGTVVGGFSCWLFLETHAPTSSSWFSKCLRKSERWTKGRYCREHKSTIVGLDHFCTWLNVAIGTSNYIPFYALAFLGTVQYVLHVAICVYVLAGPLAVLPRVLFALAGFAGLLLLFAYAALLSFHTYLAFAGVGTYDWILKQQQTELVHHRQQVHNQHSAGTTRRTPPRADATATTNHHPTEGHDDLTPPPPAA